MILLDPTAHPVIGHRGNRAFAPENTLESLTEAVALGADAVEFDVQLSRDGVLLVMHDLTIDRTTSGTGPVASHTFASLRRAMLTISASEISLSTGTAVQPARKMPKNEMPHSGRFSPMLE